MAHKWYYERDRKRFGPYSGTELKELATAGQLRPQDTVWQEGIAKGSLASRVKYLFNPPAASVAVEEPPSEAPAPTVATEEPPSPPAVATDFPEDAPLLPLEDSPPLIPAKPDPHPELLEAKKRRVLSVKGGMIVSQDGFTLRYRKKCAVCLHEDNSVASTPIRPGTMRVNFFCSKCKKSRPVEIQAIG